MDTTEALDPAQFSRRDFLGSACAVGALLALGVPLAACSSAREGSGGPPAPGSAGASASGIVVDGNTITLDLRKADTEMLATAGGFLLLEEQKVIVVNAGGTMRAFTSVCPHAGCDVSRREGDQIVCPCHGSRFGTDGQVQRGPARQALREYPASQIERIVTIHRA